ncbi:ATP-binding protein [Sporohalobacter salinus]|uniref:ATP-binding protein n=1 Tax=Sporohalobacter salinus TaxID=1494606 RepID=UPI001961A0A6|nr:DnaA/Hda family protein [Sporohalobacter salinus]MBM7623737.1 DNA replication protein DnaC [Sporohalobacter salinus]
MVEVQEAISKVIEKAQKMKEQDFKKKPSKSWDSKKNDCPYDQCNGNGFQIIEQDGRTVAIECDCREEQIISRKLEFATILEEFQDAEIVDFKVDNEHYKKAESRKFAEVCKRAAAKYVRKFQEMKKKRKGLYFYSETAGSGKTMLISAIGNELIHQHKAKVKFATAGDLLNAIRSTYSRDSEISTHELIDAARKVEVLILDDMGQQSIKSDTNDHLFDILNHRLNHPVVTIFSSNCKIEELPYSFRIRDRIKKMAIPIHAPEESARENLAEQENDRLYEKLLTG